MDLHNANGRIEKCRVGIRARQNSAGMETNPTSSYRKEIVAVSRFRR